MASLLRDSESRLLCLGLHATACLQLGFQRLSSSAETQQLLPTWLQRSAQHCSASQVRLSLWHFSSISCRAPAPPAVPSRICSSLQKTQSARGRTKAAAKAAAPPPQLSARGLRGLRGFGRGFREPTGAEGQRLAQRLRLGLQGVRPGRTDPQSGRDGEEGRALHFSLNAIF